jgi:hypothetical protein
MSVSHAILDAAEYHSQLISQLERLGNVPEQLEQQNKLIKSLNVSLGKSEDNIKKLHEETGKQRKEHQEMQNSATKKFAYTLTGRKSKYLALAGKEERLGPVDYEGDRLISFLGSMLRPSNKKCGKGKESRKSSWCYQKPWARYV